MSRRFLLGVGLGVFMFLAGCQSNFQPLEQYQGPAQYQTPRSVADVLNVVWTLQASRGDTLPIAIDAAAPFRLVFVNNDSIYGTIGCNFYSGHYQQNGQQISVTGVAASEMACPKAELPPNEVLLGQWQVTFGDTTLTLQRGDVVRVFGSAFTQSLEGFPAVGYRWRLVESNHPRFSEAKTVLTRMEMTVSSQRALRLTWPIVNNDTEQNEVKGMFNLGIQNACRLWYARWVYRGTRSAVNPAADLAVVQDMENARQFEWLSGNSEWVLRDPDTGWYYRWVRVE